MNARLAAHLLVGSLIRRVEALGGFAAVLQKGDATSGVILVQCLEKGKQTSLLERVPDYAGGYRLIACGPHLQQESDALTQYIVRRRRSDPDLWLIELDVADAERLAVESLT